MEYGVFLKPPVAPLLARHFVEARLHTDGHEHRAQILELQRRYVGHQGLPVYVVLDPGTRRVLGKFERATMDPAEFAAFLQSVL